MKKIALIFSLFAGSIIVAQSPQYLNYQGVARNASGTVINSGNIGIRFEIWRTSPTGTKVYQEEMSATPSAAGIFTTAIGSGSNTIGTFSTLNWANGPYFIVVGIDPTGGTSFTTVGTSQLLSVPYALYAEKAGNTQTVNINQSGITNVLGAYPNYTVDVAAPNLTYNSGTQVLTLTQGSAATSATITGAASGTVSMFASGIASVSPVGAGNNFTVSVQSPSFTGAGSTTVTGTYPNYLISTPIASTVASTSTNLQINPPHTTSTLSPGNYSINIVPTNISGTGVSGSYPNYTVTASPSTSITSGSANVIVNGSAPSYTISATVPVLSLTGSTLTSGPPTNSVNISSLSVWSNSIGVLYPTTLTNSVGIGTSTVASALDVTGNSTLTIGKFTNSTNTGGAVITADQIGGSSAATYYGVKTSANASGGTTYGVYATAGGGGTAYGVYGSMNGAGGYGVYGIAPAGGIGVGVAGVSNAGSTTSAFGVFGSSLNSYGGVFQNSTGTINTSLGGQTYSGIFSGGNVGINVTNPGYRLNVVENSTGLAAIFGSHNFAASSSSAHGVMGLTSNPNPLAAGIFGDNAGTGPAVYGNKTTSSGVAGRFELQLTTNNADAVFANTNGGGAALHAINGPAVAGGTNVGLWLDAGHVRSSQPTIPTTNTLTVSGGGISSATISLSAGSTDVKGTLLAVITTTGIINQNNNFVVKVNFNKPYTNPPVVVMTPASDNGVLHPFISGVSATSFTVTFKNSSSTNMTAGSPFSVNYNYMVIE